jgi:uncharacterized membrane protein
MLAPGEIVGPLSGFVVLGLIAVWFLVKVLRGIRPLSEHLAPG